MRTILVDTDPQGNSRFWGPMMRRHGGGKSFNVHTWQERRSNFGQKPFTSGLALRIGDQFRWNQPFAFAVLGRRRDLEERFNMFAVRVYQEETSPGLVAFRKLNAKQAALPAGSPA